MNSLLDLDACRRHVRAVPRASYRGRVERVSGIIVEAAGLPAAVGELCRIDRGSMGSIEAEVVGFRGATTLLVPHGDLAGIAPEQEVIALGRPFMVRVGEECLSRLVDGFGRPLDGGLPLRGGEERLVRADPPSVLERPPIREPLTTGVRSIDALSTIGRGQRLGIFSGAGVGKSALLGQIVRGTDADVLVVALVGERGREVRAFLEETLDPEQRARTVCVVATSDRSPIERYLAPFVAVTFAEAFRAQGKDVLFVMDSATRFATAAREIGLAAGEPPTVRGYPPSFFSAMPRLVERLGPSDEGSITGLLTVLCEGDDLDEPVPDTLRSLPDGHIILDRQLANRGHFPAVDPVASLSRLMPEVTTPEHASLARIVREDLALLRDSRDLIEVGAYRSGTSPRLDEALVRQSALEAFLRQDSTETSTLEETLSAMAGVFTGTAG